MTLTRVIILSPNLVLRIGLREILRAMPEVVVAGEATSPAELKGMDAEGPRDGPSIADVTLMAAAPVDWFEADSSFPNTPAALLLSDDAELAQALLRRTGPWGILPSNPSAEELSAAFQGLAEGLVVLPAHLATRMFLGTSRESALHATEKLAEPLTAREGEILGLIAQGLANKQVAAQLGISENTVKFHISSVFAKLGANSRTEAVRLGMLQGLIVI